MIRIQSLHKFFNQGKENEIHVVNDVSLELPESGMVAIFGKSGCGKTTLLNVIGGLDRYQSGLLTIEGKDIRRNTDEIRNQYIGYIFQNYNLNNGESCFENVADALRLCGMTDKAEIEKRVMSALKNVDMEKYHARTPDTLSGGQQQRIAIARAIVKNPRIILADEPTGNLDEANTVMIMDLLKKIARDHLVVMVTHEANLVDYYCDTVVELSDGKVINVRNNSGATGYTAKDKNDIFLGELEKSELKNENAQVEYYGDTPQNPVQLKIVNVGGKLYVQIYTPKVQVLDSSSEIKLREGVFEATSQNNSVSENIDMSALPPVQGKKFGKLFSFFSSVKSGYNSNFKNGKIGKKLLRLCMCLFSAVFVLMTAVFGTTFGQIINIQNSYNHNVFYVDTNDEKVSQRLSQAVLEEGTGIDFVRLYTNSPGIESMRVSAGNFETFTGNSWFFINATVLDESLLEDLTSVVGKKDNLADDELIVTTAVADGLLESLSLGYITEYKDLLGLVANDDSNSPAFRIAGIVRSNEKSVYLSSMGMARYVINQYGYSRILPASDYNIEVAEGEATFLMREEMGVSNAPKVGESIKIQGRDITVKEVITVPYMSDSNEPLHQDVNDLMYLVSDNDFIAFSKQFGETHSSLDIFSYREFYTVIHSHNPTQTEAFLSNEFSSASIITPDDFYDELIEYSIQSIVIGAVSMVVVVVLMSLCMYFIMRSSLLSRVKEVGIYRAIGTSKRNILFKFLMETLVLTTLTVFIGFLLMSGFIFLCFSLSSMVKGIFFYPVWLALIVLVVLYAICLLCGVLPVFSLLRKTPSEILAKYDI